MHVVSMSEHDIFYTFTDMIETNIIVFKMFSSKRTSGSCTNNTYKIERTNNESLKKTFRYSRIIFYHDSTF